MLSALAALAVVPTLVVPPAPSRFSTAAPFPALDWVKIDQRFAAPGIANQIARQHGRQARILWIDATANLDRVNSDDKIAALMRQVREVGFNTVVFDIKPIVGFTLYPSRLTDKLERWRDQRLPEEYDPLAAMVREAKAEGLTLFVSLNAFSEGHLFAKREATSPESPFGDPGWGYRHPELQTVQYSADPVLTNPAVPGVELAIHPTLNPPNLESGVGLYNRALASPPATSAFFVTVDAQGRVTARGDAAITTVPEGGALILARGDQVEVLRRMTFLRGRLRIGSTARFQPIGENQTQIPLMMNPHDPKVQDRALAFIREVLTGYDVDGVIYDDRLRFGGINADFSEPTRREFEAYVGRRLVWPDDVFRFTYTWSLGQGIQPGPFFDAWLGWRAMTMGDFVRKVRKTVDETRPGTLLGVYAGSWYGEYGKVGANYASPEFVAGFLFQTRAFRRTGFADQLDLLVTGCYYRIGTVAQAMGRALPVGRTVEAGGVVTNRVARDKTWSVAGIMIADYWNEPRMIESALQAAAATTQGVMVFDLSHRIDEFWPVFRRAFRTPAEAPFSDPVLLGQVRRRRAEWDRLGRPDPPFPLYEGLPGAGW